MPFVPAIEDSYDASNFRKNNSDFELIIEESDGTSEKGWASSF